MFLVFLIGSSAARPNFWKFLEDAADALEDETISNVTDSSNLINNASSVAIDESDEFNDNPDNTELNTDDPPIVLPIDSDNVPSGIDSNVDDNNSDEYFDTIDESLFVDDENADDVQDVTDQPELPHVPLFNEESLDKDKPIASDKTPTKSPPTLKRTSLWTKAKTAIHRLIRFIYSLLKKIITSPFKFISKLLKHFGMDVYMPKLFYSTMAPTTIRDDWWPLG